MEGIVNDAVLTASVKSVPSRANLWRFGDVSRGYP
jgi:hypothetical protein